MWPACCWMCPGDGDGRHSSIAEMAHGLQRRRNGRVHLASFGVDCTDDGVAPGDRSGRIGFCDAKNDSHFGFSVLFCDSTLRRCWACALVDHALAYPTGFWGMGARTHYWRRARVGRDSCSCGFLCSLRHSRVRHSRPDRAPNQSCCDRPLSPCAQSDVRVGHRDRLRPSVIVWRLASHRLRRSILVCLPLIRDPL